MEEKNTFLKEKNTFLKSETVSRAHVLLFGFLFLQLFKKIFESINFRVFILVLCFRLPLAALIYESKKILAVSGVSNLQAPNIAS